MNIRDILTQIITNIVQRAHNHALPRQIIPCILFYMSRQNIVFFFKMFLASQLRSSSSLSKIWCQACFLYFWCSKKMSSIYFPWYFLKCLKTKVSGDFWLYHTYIMYIKTLQSIFLLFFFTLGRIWTIWIPPLTTPLNSKYIHIYLEIKFILNFNRLIFPKIASIYYFHN